ncbi:hypothetical protein [Zhihengliuella halotolerans]|uniref:hypothetical protein n=1 Tax=Zhihengliuella halotolerans TaxID=370736 RepID=UPI000C7F8C90|nr:hypothetical protein [Zhihengliuella halotolerans]
MDLDGSSYHSSPTEESTIGDHEVDWMLNRCSDGAGTQAFITVDHTDPWTPGELDDLARTLQNLATRIREVEATN